MSYGPKFVPHKHPAQFLSKDLSCLPRELQELRRTLLWSVYFNKVEKGHNAFNKLPHRPLHRSTGITPSSTIEDKLSLYMSTIDGAVQSASDQILLLLSDLNSSHFPRRGISWRSHLVQDYLSRYVIVSGDKDSSQVIMSISTYQAEVKANMQSTNIYGESYYCKLAEVDDVAAQDNFLMQAKNWQSSLALICLDSVPNSIAPVIEKYFRTHPDPTWANFHLLCKTHKSKAIVNGRWRSRPIVGLVRWATTACSKLLAVLGNIFLTLDRFLSPDSTPLKDSMDAIHRLHSRSTLWDNDPHFNPQSLSYDFTSLYTNFNWTDCSRAFKFWMQYFFDHEQNINGLFTAEELDFVRWLNEPISVETFSAYHHLFPYSHIEYHPTLSFGEYLFHIIFTHVLFRCPGLGLFRQCIGFPMGTNCAAQWANLILRMFELQSDQCQTLVSQGLLTLLRFIDDGLCFFPISIAHQIKPLLYSMYPEHLSFEFECDITSENIIFLDIRIIRLHKLISTIYFKPTHTCCYILWTSNHPRSIKLGWIKGELIRFLRICSHVQYFHICVNYLVGALKRLGYPASAYTPLPVAWHDRDRYMKRCERPETKDIIHIIRAPHHSAFPISFSSIIRTVQSRMRSILPNLRLYVTLRPALSLRQVFLSWKNKTLRRPELQAREEADFEHMVNLLCDLAAGT